MRTATVVLYDRHIDAVHVNQGNQAAGGDGIEQAVATTVGSTYEFTATLSERDHGRGDHTALLEVIDANGTVIATETVLVRDGNANTTLVWISFEATTDETTVRITNSTSTNTHSTNLRIDEVSLIETSADVAFGDGGNDSIDGGDGDDFIVGDNGVLVAPSTSSFDPVNTDNLQDAGDTEAHKAYAAELVTLANGDLVMISSERGTSYDDGISSYKIDNDPTSATYGQIIGTNPNGNGHTDLGAKIDSAGFQSPGGRIDAGYNEIADLAAVTLDNGSTFVYSADFNRDAIGITRIEADGSLTEISVLQNSHNLDRIKELSIVEVGVQSYLLALSTGHSDKLISYAINDDGSLTQADIVSDGSGTGEKFLNGGDHLGSASLLESFTNSAGETFVVAGGEDDGIAIWTLDATGQGLPERA